MSENNENYQDLEDYFRSLHEEKRFSFEEIRKKGKQISQNSDLVDEIIENLKKYQDDIIHIPIPSVISANPLKISYFGPKDSHIFWPKYKKHLKVEKEFPDDVINSIDDSTTKIISYMRNPNDDHFKLKGLVVGYVQSGKTANYMGVISKAADIGFKLFIILTSCNNKLRRQTQARIEHDLCNLNKNNWHRLTTRENDFRANEPDPNSKIAKGFDKYGRKIRDFDRTICVVKKNSNRLGNLIGWLKQADTDKLRLTPVLLIDDEADQASINTKSKEDPSTINRKIREIIDLLNKVVYVGYTASPFANVLIDPSAKDLYPEDFIFDLPKPKRYFGSERLFGREVLQYDNSIREAEIGKHPSNPDKIIEYYKPGMNIIHEVPNDDVYLLKPRNRREKEEFIPTLAKSLKRAIKYFWLATAARHFRGQSQKHSTMLIHTTSYSKPQNKFEDKLVDYKNSCVLRIVDKNTREEEINKFRKIWEEEQEKVDSTSLDPPLIPVSFDYLKPHLKDVMRRTQIFIENSTIKKEDRLVYGDEPGIFIVVGGNILSRGLTLEGLVVSYFIRTVSAYDTLLQMGRWFGFRIGYEDLPRIWMTNEFKGYFLDLATVEEEIRYDIQRYFKENLTPLDFGVRIRRHPSLLITSRLKMQDIIDSEISYSERRVQTTIFKVEDRTWLMGNLNATKKLFANIGRDPELDSLGYNSACWGLENIKVKHILQFIDDYTFHENHIQLNKKLLKKYIKDENNNNGLNYWNIMIMSIHGEIDDPLDLGFSNNKKVNLISRSRATTVNIRDANLKSIMLRNDTVLDLDDDEVKEAMKKNDDLFRIRTKKSPDKGLLTIYPIYKESTPSGNNPRTLNPNKPLEAKEHVIGVGFVFPKSKNHKGERYVTVRMSGLKNIEIEDEPVEDDDFE
ncbi:hypothetical protein LCGC14_0940910 [marine sediment metagenome]|uniref:Putative endonuclease Z1 domain-containing protein n=1 Tax=marine sediment metagenome TaxID=412755 RepID=A0A0F9NPR0_9ZZZZ